MRVKDILSLAADLLGRQDLVEELFALDGAPTGELQTLLRCYNLVENEVALDYFPQKTTERLTAAEGKLYYTAFSRSPVEICRILDGAGRSVRFEEFPEHLALSVSGAVEVTYAYAPEDKEIDGQCEFKDVSARLLAFGVAGEFCLTAHKYEEAKLWQGRYRDALRSAGIVRHPLSIRARRWV